VSRWRAEVVPEELSGGVEGVAGGQVLHVDCGTAWWIRVSGWMAEVVPEELSGGVKEVVEGRFFLRNCLVEYREWVEGRLYLRNCLVE
jgi:hypothetical protein